MAAARRARAAVWRSRPSLRGGPDGCVGGIRRLRGAACVVGGTSEPAGWLARRGARIRSIHRRRVVVDVRRGQCRSTAAAASRWVVQTPSMHAANGDARRRGSTRHRSKAAPIRGVNATDPTAAPRGRNATPNSLPARDGGDSRCDGNFARHRWRPSNGRSRIVRRCNRPRLHIPAPLSEAPPCNRSVLFSRPRH